MSRRTLATTAVVLLGAVPLLATGPARAEEPTDPGKLLLMLDASGSMKAKDPSGLTKIAAAKKALTGVVGALPDNAQVGLRVYGATQPGGRPTPAACHDTQLVHPITTLDKPGLTKAIAAFQAKGETPIAYSIQQAVNDLGPDGKRNIVLVSDGQESCTPDPCPQIKKALGTGINLQIDTVGFAVDPKAKKQLQCIADAGKGTYYDAKSAGELALTLGKLSQRATRPFTVQGAPIHAAERPEQAPVLKPGQYVDSLVAKSPARYYRLHRTPGTSGRLTVVGRPPREGDITDSETLRITTQTPTGEDCQTQSDSSIEFFRGGESQTVGMYLPGPNDDPSSSSSTSSADPCAGTDLLVKIQREAGGATPLPVEVRYAEEPTATNAAQLPPAVDETWAKHPFVATASGEGTPVVGGGSLSGAVPLRPGTYTDVLLNKEQLFYKVHLDYGQQASFIVDLPAPGHSRTLPSATYQVFQVNAYTPDGIKLTRVFGTDVRNRKAVMGSDGAKLYEYTPQVRYNNRLSDDTQARLASVPGDYVFSVLRQDSYQNAPADLPIRLAVTVQGTATGKPTYAAGVTAPSGAASTSPTTSPSGTPSGTATSATDRASSSEPVSPAVWGGLGLAGAAALGGLAWAVTRHRPGRRP